MTGLKLEFRHKPKPMCTYVSITRNKLHYDTKIHSLRRLQVLLLLNKQIKDFCTVVSDYCPLWPPKRTPTLTNISSNAVVKRIALGLSLFLVQVSLMKPVYAVQLMEFVTEQWPRAAPQVAKCVGKPAYDVYIVHMRHFCYCFSIAVIRVLLLLLCNFQVLYAE